MHYEVCQGQSVARPASIASEDDTNEQPDTHTDRQAGVRKAKVVQGKQSQKCVQKQKEKADGQSVSVKAAGSDKRQTKVRKRQKRGSISEKDRIEHVNTPANNVRMHTSACTHTPQRAHMHSPTNSSARTREFGSEHTGATQHPPDSACSEADSDVSSGVSDANNGLTHTHP